MFPPAPPTLGDRLRRGKRGRRERVGRRAWEIHLYFHRCSTACGKRHTRRDALLPRAKLHEAGGREEHPARRPKAHKATVRRHGQVRVACVPLPIAVLRDKVDKLVEQLCRDLQHRFPLSWVALSARACVGLGDPTILCHRSTRLSPRGLGRGPHRSTPPPARRTPGLPTPRHRGSRLRQDSLHGLSGDISPGGGGVAAGTRRGDQAHPEAGHALEPHPDHRSSCARPPWKTRMRTRIRRNASGSERHPGTDPPKPSREQPCCAHRRLPCCTIPMGVWRATGSRRACQNGSSQANIEQAILN